MKPKLETRNFNHYMDVRRARAKLGLDVDIDKSIDHIMVGKALKSNSGKIYVVEKAMRHWYWGTYVALLLNCDDSHRLIFWESETCDDEAIMSGIESARMELVPCCASCNSTDLREDYSCFVCFPADGSGDKGL